MTKKESLFDMGETIAAIATPAGEGGIGIVRMTGSEALSIADRMFVSKKGRRPSVCSAYSMHYGHIVGKDENSKSEIVDEVLLTVMRAPESYTREDVVEINCHGGIVALRKVLDLTLSLGARVAEPGEFTKRAFINGRIDLAQAEAVLDIIKSKTESSMKVALGHLEGDFSHKIKSMRTRLIDSRSEIEAEIDFSDEDITLVSKNDMFIVLENISGEIQAILNDAWKGMILKEGILCVICGKPNVGKSTLMNVFLKRNRVIVTPLPGTTRDAIEEEISLKGMPLRIVDTAGISRARNIAEKHGIRKSRSYIGRADLIIFMLDLSKPWSKSDTNILKSIKRKNFIVIANKCDRKRRLDLKKIREKLPEHEIIELSLRRNIGAERLEGTILKKISRGEILHPEGTFVTSLRHKKYLENAEKCISKARKTLMAGGNPSPEILASDLKDAIYSLGSILGENVEPDILGNIFSRFCVGK